MAENQWPKIDRGMAKVYTLNMNPVRKKANGQEPKLISNGMKTEVINVKTDPKTKKLAQKAAQNLGVSLSVVINGLLKQFIFTETVTLTNKPTAEEPSEWLIKSLAEADRDEKEGWVSPNFDNFEHSLNWLNDPKRRYINGKIAKGDR